jgi:hypothetical protein
MVSAATPTQVGSAGRYTQVLRSPSRLEAALSPPQGRRSWLRVRSVHVAEVLAAEAKPTTRGVGAWQHCRIEPYGIVAASERPDMPPYYTLRRVLGALERAGVMRWRRYQFPPAAHPPGRIDIDRYAVVHDPAVATESYLQLRDSSVAQVAAEHHLADHEVGLLTRLCRLAEPSTWRWVGTQCALAAELHASEQGLHVALMRLRRAGLVDEWSATPGVGTSLRVSVAASLVVTPQRRAPCSAERAGAASPAQPATPAPAATPPKRHERREAPRELHHGACELAQRLVTHHGLAGRPSPSLVGALAAALDAGVGCTRLAEAVAGRGSLTGANDPMAVLVTRARQVGADLVAEAVESQARREATEAARAAGQAGARAEQVAMVVEAEASRGLAAQLDDGVLAELRAVVEAGRSVSLGAGALEATIKDWARRAQAGRLDLGLVDAIGAALAGGALGDEAAAAAVILPRCRDGPSLAERLRHLG